MEKKTSLVGSFESYMCKKTRSNNINCWILNIVHL